MIMCSSEMESELFQKQYSFRNESRKRSIEQMKSQVRKEIRAINHVNELIETLPKEMTEAQQWCYAVLQHFKVASSYSFPDWKIIQLFRMVEKFPCTITLKLFYIIIHKVTLHAIHELFQYDIMSFLLGIINFPEKRIKSYQLGDLKFAEIELVRKCILIISEICEMSEKARNFIVCTHKGFTSIKRAYSRFGEEIKTEYLTCLFSFTKHKMNENEQFKIIIKNVIKIYARTNIQHEVRILGRSLVNALRTGEDSIISLIGNKYEYDLVARSLEILKLLQNSTPTQLLSQAYHAVCLFLLCYIEIGRMVNFPWDSLFQQWFYILFRRQSVLSFARQGIYFGLGRVLQQINSLDSDFQLFYSLIFNYDLLKILSAKLHQQNGWETINELCLLIKTVFELIKNWNLLHCILDSNSFILQSIMQFIINNYYTVYPEALEELLQGVSLLFSESYYLYSEDQLHQTLLSRITPYYQKLLSYSVSFRSHKVELRRNETLDEHLQNLIRVIQPPL